jgi:hypothetical protein
MSEKFVKYRSFNDKALAVELYDKLSAAGIQVAWEDTVGYFDASFANNEFLNIYYVKLHPRDFKAADELLLNTVSENVQEPVSDYYLFSFSNDELIEVLQKPDEWNEFDMYWARKILTTRGVEIKEYVVERAKTERLDELKKPWIVDKIWLLFVAALWLAGLFFIHFYLSSGVVFIGAYIWLSKKTMPNGERVKAFSDSDRRWARAAFFAGVLLTIYLFLGYYGGITFIDLWP